MITESCVLQEIGSPVPFWERLVRNRFNTPVQLPPHLVQMKLAAQVNIGLCQYSPQISMTT